MHHYYFLKLKQNMHFLQLQSLHHHNGLTFHFLVLCSYDWQYVLCSYDWQYVLCSYDWQYVLCSYDWQYEIGIKEYSMHIKILSGIEDTIFK